MGTKGPCAREVTQRAHAQQPAGLEGSSRILQSGQQLHPSNVPDQQRMSTGSWRRQPPRFLHSKGGRAREGGVLVCRGMSASAGGGTAVAQVISAAGRTAAAARPSWAAAATAERLTGNQWVGCSSTRESCQPATHLQSASPWAGSHWAPAQRGCRRGHRRVNDRRSAAAAVAARFCSCAGQLLRCMRAHQHKIARVAGLPASPGGPRTRRSLRLGLVGR